MITKMTIWILMNGIKINKLHLVLFLNYLYASQV